MQFEEKKVMRVQDEKIEPLGFKKHDFSDKIDEREDVKESSGGKNLNLDSAVDISGKKLEIPLINEDKSGVEELYVYKNELNLIPRAVGRFRGLKTLKFFSNEVNLFPAEFRNLVELECLQVKVVAPGVSGLELSKLRNLKELELSRVPPRPSAFPILSEIAGLKRLTRLSVCHFSIRYLPPEIGCLSNLECLDLSFNKMRNLPDEITALNSLISLKVANNKLIELPVGLSHLKRLENLDLSNNRLTSLCPLELESMHSLQSLNLQHNQLRGCRIPSWICCNLAGNSRDTSIDESAEMDVYEGVIDETDNSPGSGYSAAPSGHLSGLSNNNRCLAARRAKGWKRRYNLNNKTRPERLNNCKKWKIDSASRSSSGKCTACRVAPQRDDVSSEVLSVVTDAEAVKKDILPESEVNETSHISPANEDFIGTKESVDKCSCSVTDCEGLPEELAADDSESNAILESASDAVELLDEGSSSQSFNGLVKSKRHSEKDLDNPKPTKSRRSINDPSYLSRQYSERSFCGVGDYLLDGFYDAGRGRPFLPLDSFQKNLHVNSREVILLDREKDEDLDAILQCARTLVYRFKHINRPGSRYHDVAIDTLQIASLLALFVSDHFGGSDKSAVIQKTRKAVSGSNYRKPFVCTCATGIGANANEASKQDLGTVEDIVFLDLCEKSLQSIKERHNSAIVPIGGLKFGVCRHRALLMKYLCDRMDPQIPCELVRGYLDFSPHAWNVVVIKRGDSLVRMIVDACHPHDIREENDPEYFCRYVPLSKMGVPLLDSDGGSPNSSFPSLPMREKIGTQASTSLMSFTIGSVEAAVKIRSVEVTDVSTDDIRNFEFCCLGEVRMLSLLKHPCIVEFYGHQISSKWSKTEDGNADVRVMQSAIMMEYIKGGSLKTYLEKLSSSGKKHVSPVLSIYIARDIALALSELHSRHIIHRDVKSENVLIDLEKKRQDGTPVVKICDFDRAVPLHSYLHTCCISHAGIPPPDICVGTPRWMAPEVFHAMHKRNIYGLEVDIWSFGCLLLELLTLQVPYYGLPDSEINDSLQNGKRPRLPEDLESLAQSDGDIVADSKTLQFLVTLYHQCTEEDPADRPSAKRIYNLLCDHASSIIDSRCSEEA